MRLTDTYPQRRAFVSGAASGLGRAFCRQLADDGWTLCMADIDGMRLQEAAEAIEQRGGTAHPVVLDVSEGAAVQAAADEFVTDAGGIDLVINNAGIGAGGTFTETSLEDWRHVLDVNLMGVVHGCKAFAEPLQADGGGHLINIASIAAVAAAPRMSIYNTTKAGVLALSETLYSELHDAGVHVSVALPHFFETNIDQSMRGSDADRQIARHLMDRSDATADDVARYVLKEAGRGTLHITFPFKAKVVWYWKRLLPTHYLSSMIDRFRSSLRFVERFRSANE
jgi:NADP-dependent 3-hydroxy acid dehydrogenase YdfG